MDPSFLNTREYNYTSFVRFSHYYSACNTLFRTIISTISRSNQDPAWRELFCTSYLGSSNITTVGSVQLSAQIQMQKAHPFKCSSPFASPIRHSPTNSTAHYPHHPVPQVLPESHQRCSTSTYLPSRALSCYLSHLCHPDASPTRPRFNLCS
ncbi:hypothetical protein BCR34DRAFT_301233 [Clohesyomyces aquaticus]|uniref:Uncharacterized protein n=1 Tax=Clohesyomyces aquaticus TaxID=1231657 RepID=A0A1Y1ZQG3_9PLEO|nr:hypothetical protein BCR34DRAFT_301233 [Clohesyomyces aquaticus]